MRRSRGGRTAKVHGLVDANILPMRLKITEGQDRDGRSADDILGSVQAGHVLLADRPTIPTGCARNSQNGAPGPNSAPCHTGSIPIWLRHNESMA